MGEEVCGSWRRPSFSLNPRIPALGSNLEIRCSGGEALDPKSLHTGRVTSRPLVILKFDPGGLE